MRDQQIGSAKANLKTTRQQIIYGMFRLITFVDVCMTRDVLGLWTLRREKILRQNKKEGVLRLTSPLEHRFKSRPAHHGHLIPS
jgi:hypothetical protein